MNTRRELLRQFGWVSAYVAISLSIEAPAASAGGQVSVERKRRPKALTILDFGAKGDGKTDSRAAIQKAFDHAKANGLDVFIPAGTFLHSGTLTANGIRVFGGGDDSILKASTYGQEALYLKGAGV